MAISSLQSLRRPSIPLHVEVTDLLRNQILSGELNPGAQLPALSELSAKLGVAKMTVRQAMDSLEAEGLIERHSGRGTFVRDVAPHRPQILTMQADLEQLHKMVDELEVQVSHRAETDRGNAGSAQVSLKRTHMLQGKPFCIANLTLTREIYDIAPERFESEIVVSVLKELGTEVATAKQRVTISYANAEAAKTLGIHINSPVMQVFRQFLDAQDQVVYSAELTYPSHAIGFEIEFKV